MRSIEVYINFEKHSDCKAYCSYMDNNIKPRMFDISIDPRISKTAQLKALAHEMVHVKQYARGELQEYVTPKKANKRIKWQGKNVLDKSEICDDGYWTSPWEIEAYGREIGLFYMYKEHLKTK